MKATRICSIENCQGHVKARTWCLKHYRRWQRNGDPEILPGRTASTRRSTPIDPRSPAAIQRFEAKVDRSGDCHRWTGAHTYNGYGRVKYGDRIRGAHEAALLLSGVEIPPGMEIDHVWARGCKYRDCVRVKHLEVVTPRENTLRGNSISAINARKTHCKRGHPLSGNNLLVVKHGRNCRACADMHERNRKPRPVAHCPECDKGIKGGGLAAHRERMHTTAPVSPSAKGA